MKARGNVLVLWNQVEDDVYERWRAEGPRPLPWDPERYVPDVGTVAEEMNAIIEGIRQCGYTVHVVNAEDELDRIISAIRLYRPDVVVNLIEYFNDDASHESYVAALYELLDVSYTGSRPLILATCQNKHRTKVLLEAAGLPTARYVLVEGEPVPHDHGLEFPLIVKPVSEDASGGIELSSVVRDQGALEEQIRRVLKEYQMPALVEEYIEGREIHAALLGNDPPEVLPLFEMQFDEPELEPDETWRPQIISYRAKWDPHSPEFYSMDSTCPARDLDSDVEEYIRRIALDAFRALGCRDYARIDMRLDEESGEVFILEVNPNPDLSDGAAYMQCAVASGRTFSGTLGEIVELAMERARSVEDESEPARDLPSDHLLREWVLGASVADGAAAPGGPSAPEGGASAAPAEEPARPVKKRRRSAAASERGARATTKQTRRR